jgi:hypothetical protein
MSSTKSADKVDRYFAAERTWIRVQAGCDRDARVTVMIEEGDAVPELLGRQGYWTTPSGKTVVHHPAAYGWRCCYHCSTERVEVGRAWLDSHSPWRIVAALALMPEREPVTTILREQEICARLVAEAQARRAA